MTAHITVSTAFQTCTDPQELGYVALLQGAWFGGQVVHPDATPLKCICDYDIDSFKVKINYLPKGYIVYAKPQGSDFTSSATVSSNIVLFKLPANVKDVECWTIEIDDPKSSAQPYAVWVRLERTHSP